MNMPSGTTMAGSSPTGSAMNSSMGDMGGMMGMGGSCQISVSPFLSSFVEKSKSSLN